MRADSPTSYPSIISCQERLARDGWVVIPGSSWWTHPKFPGRRAGVIASTPMQSGRLTWRTHFTGPVVRESFRRYVFSAKQQTALMVSLRDQLEALKRLSKATAGTEHSAAYEEQRLKVGELLHIIAEGGKECDEDGDEDGEETDL